MQYEIPLIASDTDSVYLGLSSIIPTTITDQKEKNEYLKFIADNFGKKIIQNTMKGVDVDLNSLTLGVIDADREVIAPRAIFIAKKKYAMLISNIEGVEYVNYDLKVTGLDSVSSKTPKQSQKALEEMYRIVLEEDAEAGDEFVEVFRKIFETKPLNDRAVITGVNHIKKYENGQGGCLKGTSQNSRAAITHNSFIKEKSLDKDIELIKEGDKIKMIFLKEPNNVGSPVFAYKEWNECFESVVEYLDDNKLFERAFYKSAKIVFKALDYERKTHVEMDLC